MEKYKTILNLLLKPYWGNMDIYNYFDYTDSSICMKKVIDLRPQAESKGGAVSYVQRKVTVEVIGKDINSEISTYSNLVKKVSRNE